MHIERGEDMDYLNLINQYLTAFKKISYKDTKSVYKISNNLYDAMYQQYDLYTDASKQYVLCKRINDIVLPKIDKTIMNAQDLRLGESLLVIRKRFFALSARRILRNFAFYMEQYKTKKFWDKTADTMESLFYYLDVFSVSNVLELLRGSMPPSFGKSYIANLYVAQCIGNNPNAQILRITYSDDLCISTTRQTADIIDSQAFREIYPRYEKYKGDKIFKVHTSYQLCIIDNEDQYNLNSVTREGQSTGKRATLLIIDDLLKDDKESYNKDLHKTLLNRYDSTWTSRADGDDQKILLLGTMWADTDLLNVVYDRALIESDIIKDKKHKYTEVSKNGDSVFIGIPALDENDKSTCPMRFSTDKLLRKRKTMDRFLWMCVYQQDPIAPEGLEFDYGSLNTYKKLPKKQPISVYASLDPARKGKNFVAMPIFCQYEEDGKYYLVDFLYQKKSMSELYTSIVQRIVQHKVNKIVVENNTDTSLAYVLKTKLHEIGYFNCEFIEKYSYENKEKRISNHQGNIRANVLFPEKGTIVPTSEFGKAMESITSFSFNYPNKFDDAIDSVCLFVQEFISESYKFAKVTSFNRNRLGF